MMQTQVSGGGCETAKALLPEAYASATYSGCGRHNMRALSVDVPCSEAMNFLS